MMDRDPRAARMTKGGLRTPMLDLGLSSKLKASHFVILTEGGDPYQKPRF